LVKSPLSETDRQGKGKEGRAKAKVRKEVTKQKGRIIREVKKIEN
jgi:hypothetical protein